MVGDMYYMITLVIFLVIGGHRQMIRGIRDSFDTLPLMSVAIDHSVLDLVVQMCSPPPLCSRYRLAAPMLVTMLIVDMTLGFLGKTMPQMNVMTMGLSIKAMVGIIGASLS